ncbi:MAG: ATP-binding protein [Candidatus Ranarchaeia archaeon]
MQKEDQIVGQIIAGQAGKILIRQKSEKQLELGQLLVVDNPEGHTIFQVNDLAYGSQIPQDIRELIAGFQLEGFGAGLDFLDPKLRNYIMAKTKPLVKIQKKDKKTTIRIPKTLPDFFSTMRKIKKSDLDFLTKPKNPIFMGKIRSGSKVLDVDVYLNGNDVLTHHLLIPATTGRGKSNLVKVMLWSALKQGKFGILVLDPHDEYYGRHDKGLKDNPKAKDNLVYYSTSAPTGTLKLMINLKTLKPWHFNGIVHFSQPQKDAITLYNRQFGENWIVNLVGGAELKDDFAQSTLAVLRRKFNTILGVFKDEDNEIQCRSNVFTTKGGLTTTKDIVRHLEDGRIVIVDTSRLLDQAELLIGSIVCRDIFNRYQQYKANDNLKEKPVVSVVIEEAPRVLGKEVIKEMGENIYSTIAREGRKFKIGLIAITQLTSLIPRTVLANMNTKIILGNEMSIERTSIMESAAQDLSDDNLTIKTLDKGEAIISSSFTNFAVPIYTPLFEEFIEKQEPRKKTTTRVIS